MTLSPSPARIARFGVFDLDPRTGELCRRGIRVHLQDHPFQVLVALIERAGDLVTRDELKQRLWSGSVFVDFEQGLNNAIAKIRMALGDSAERPRFVETLERRGYRFIASVEFVTTEPQAARVQTIPQSRVPATMVRLAMAGQTVALAEGTHTIGRDPGASLWIDSALVSRRHARIVVLNGHVTIEDLGSRNGTLLNGDRLTAASSLKDGDEIELGSVPVSVRISSGMTGTIPADDVA